MWYTNNIALRVRGTTGQSGTFDAVICNDTFQYIVVTEARAVIEEFRRVLRNGGRLCMGALVGTESTDPPAGSAGASASASASTGGSGRGSNATAPYQYVHSADDVKLLLAQSGFQVSGS